jgi:PAS domain S-box-containing protein
VIIISEDIKVNSDLFLDKHNSSRNQHKNDYLSELKRLKQNLELTHTFLNIANQHTELDPLLNEFVREIKHLTGCEAVGVRLLDREGNIPYEAYDGFSQSFYNSESPLSIHSDKCMCISVIKKEYNPELSFFTEAGSFFMNGTTRFLATVSEEEKGETRNVCNATGYESVALIPITLRDRTLGLFHLADKREGMVPLKIIKVLEVIAMQLATALQRVWTQQDLKESEKRFRRLFNRVFDAIIIINKDRRIVDANEATFRLFGYSKPEILNLRIKDLCLHDEIERIEQAIDNTLLNGIDYIDEITLSSREGNIIKAEAGWTALKTMEENYIIGSFRDITDRKKKEEMTQLLISLLSHDLKTPFTAIKGFLELAQADIKSSMIDNYVSEALIGTSRAINLVNNSVTMLKLSEQHSYEFYPINITETLIDVEESINSQFLKKKIEINLINIGKNTTILADLLFERLLWNLLSNSIKNDDSQDKIEIDIELKKMREKSFLIISDKAKGIPPKLRKKLNIQRFSVFKKSGEGSGLGMWLINQLANRYGWKFSIESRVPSDYTKGTRFKFDISG